MMKRIACYLTAFVLATGAAFCAHAEPAPAASVTTNGVTTFYSSLTNAWADAIAYRGVDVLITMLEDATIESTLAHDNHGFGGVLTLDLNGYVLAYAGTADACVISQSTGPGLDIIDTDTTRRTPRYFTSDQTGLWTLTNEVTELMVRGGLITGGRAGAVSITWGSHTHVISNVNFVGNRSSQNGGAVLGTYGALEISRSTFLGNVADMDGGAVYASVPCTMTDCRVEANGAGGRGAGAYLTRCGSLTRTGIVRNRAGTSGGGVYLEFNAGPCFPAGVKIRMADGSEKNVENIVKGDVVATFDHEGGTNSSAAVFYVYSGTRTEHVFTLSFVSGTTLDIAGHHDLLLENTRKYVTISSDNARSYLGRRFYNYATATWDELTGVTQAKDCDAHYSLYTRGHINCVANGMLTAADDVDFYLNVYELDESLKADAAQLAADIATYGLAEPADYPNIPIDDFVDANIRFARIAIGKGLTTQEEILFWNEYDYGPVVAEKVASAPKLTTAAAAPMSTTSTSVSTPFEPYLQVGDDTVVTGNVSAAGTDNVYLKPSVSFSGTKYNPVIDILPDATGIDIGVKLSTGAGDFGWTNAVNYASSFFADDPSYSVSYTADGVLALRAGIQVGGDAWATVEDGLCTIIGTGDMWSYAVPGTSPLWGCKGSITNVVIGDAVTGVGTNFFAYMKGVKDVEIGGAVTNVAQDAFYFCIGMTNLVVGAGVQSVGDNAFERCNSLTTIRFASMALAEACAGRTFKVTARITLDGGEPVVDCVPDVIIDAFDKKLKGKRELSDSEWETIDNIHSIPKEYHFFKYAYEPVN